MWKYGIRRKSRCSLQAPSFYTALQRFAPEKSPMRVSFIEATATSLNYEFLMDLKVLKLPKLATRVALRCLHELNVINLSAQYDRNVSKLRYNMTAL